MSEQIAWVGVDLDGTLAEYTKWQGITHIGNPIKPMVEYVQDLIESGIEVRIFTARCQEGAIAIDCIKVWCLRNIGYDLKVTDRKDFAMVFLVDDRAVAVEKNTGKFLNQPPTAASVLYHYSKSNPDNPDYVAEESK